MSDDRCILQLEMIIVYGCGSEVGSVAACVRRCWGWPRRDVAADALLSELGLESFTAVRLRRRLRTELGVDLPLSAFLGSRMPDHLTALGFPAPRRSVVDSRAAYSSRFYRISKDFAEDRRCISIGNNHPAPPEAAP